jgi:hypothetical protein
MVQAIPHWLVVLATVSLAAAAASALVIAADLAASRRQKMWIMNLVWPLTALYAGPIAVWAYWRLGRKEIAKPFWQQVALGATHCGSGCALGDIVAEWITFFVPLTLFGTTVFATWAIDYVLAFAFGIAFQYFTIAPMRGLSLGEGLRAAVKADALSLTAWQVGMYGWMAIAIFGIFGNELDKGSVVFWFMMQIAMLSGFITAYPVTWWLLRRGVKEPM